MVVEDETRGNIDPTVGVFLVTHRLAPANNTSGDMNRQSAVLLNLNTICPAEAKLNFFRVAKGLHNEVIFELLLLAIVNEIHSRIDLMKFYFGEGRDTCAPFRGIRPQYIISDTREGFNSFAARLVI